MDNNTLNNLNTNLETCRNLIEIDAIKKIYNDIKKLLDLNPEMRKQLLSKWKYYNEFLLSIDEHCNDEYICNGHINNEHINNENINNEQHNRHVKNIDSFIKTFLSFIFH